MGEAFITRRNGGSAVEAIEFTTDPDRSWFYLDELKRKKRFLILLQGFVMYPFVGNLVSLYYDNGNACLVFYDYDNNTGTWGGVHYAEGTTDIVTFNEYSGKVEIIFRGDDGIEVKTSHEPYKCWIFE